MESKTNALRALDKSRIAYSVHAYTGAVSGAEVAAALGEEPERVFKTLVTEGASGRFYVFVVPSDSELELKKAAAHVGEKSVAMIKAKELLPLTGYIHGGCSPLGMKKLFPTAIDETAGLFDTIYISGGRVGLQLEIAPAELRKALPFTLADLT